MTFNQINRRTHLYLALGLLPWFLVYGISSLAIQHGDLFTFGDEPRNPPWEKTWEKAYERDVPEDPDWRQIGAQMLEEVGFEGLFHINTRDPKKIVITRFSFWSQDRLTWHPEEDWLAAEHQGLDLRTFIVWMHIRGGFGQESFLADLWAIIVDIVNVGFVLWVLSGLYMWWLLPSIRKWGFLAIGCGVLSFAWFLVTL
jgi:hypothetical protein